MRLAAVVGLCALALVPQGAAGGSADSVRALVILATWGPQPVEVESVRRVVFDDAAAWIGRSSYGKVALAGDVTPWLPAFDAPPDCFDRAGVSRAARAAATTNGFDLNAYSRLIYLLPPGAGECGGYGSGEEVWIFGVLSRWLITHELGHTFDLRHANRWDCSAQPCRSVEYGNRYSTMGSGPGDFNAWEKSTAGWLSNISRATRNGDYVIDQLEAPSNLPQALVVDTANAQYWLDHREPLLNDAEFAGSEILGGVFVHAGPNADPTDRSLYPVPNLLLPDPARRGVDVLLPGDSFARAGAFRLTVLGHEETSMRVRFQWTDRTRPNRPRVISPRPGARVAGPLLVSWSPARDTGSGVLHYDVFLDGKRAARVLADFRVSPIARFRKQRPGLHSVTVVAVDRAANRSPAGRVRFVA